MTNKAISPTSIAQYIRLENCDRYLRFRLKSDDLHRMLKRWNLTEQPLTPLLEASGAAFEENVAERIAAHGEQVIDLNETKVEDTISALQAIKKPTILLQASLSAQLGDYTCSGRSDAIRVERAKSGALKILVADMKASRHERMEHRLQVAVYANLLRKMAALHNIPIESIQGTILTIQEDGSFPALTPDSQTFDLDTYLTILDRLMVTPDSKVNQILAQPFEDVFYHLSYKCDGCLYNSICMYDSAERLDIAITPAITAVEKRVLNEAGVCTLPELASLMDYPAANSGQLVPARGKEAVLDLLRNRWPVAPNLPFLVQRAKAAQARLQRDTDSRPFLLGAGYGTLPSDEEHPQLVKIFFDAQHDYIQNRMYLLAALVSGPNGSQQVVRITSEPPTDATEQALLEDWVLSVLQAARAVAQSEHAPVHLYCYNRYDQKVLLEALKRHLDSIAAIPAFFDLLTQSPALSQSVISFLYDELRERTNFGLACMPLHDAARWVKFNWQDEHFDYFSLFRARMFDNRRTVTRGADGRLLPALKEDDSADPNKVNIESSSRFNSQIPLEYAYGAWNMLPDVKKTRDILKPFRAVDMDALRAFAGMRVKALAHIETSFKYKARFIEKPAVHLPALASSDGRADLRTTLEEFLFMEHHSKFQELLLHYSMPVDKRVQSGRSMLLKYVRPISNESALFQPEFSSLGLDPVITMNACRLKEGDWVVMNDTSNPQLTAGRVKGGRLAVIDRLSPDEVVLTFRDNIFKGKKLFINYHEKVALQGGHLYVLDEMADDLNADKVLESLRNPQSNIFFHWLVQKPAARDNASAMFYQQFTAQIDMLLLAKKRKLTAAQKSIIGDTEQHPLVLVQGPPGTGKSYTLAWAILARIAAASMRGQTCRVAVCCKTHNAIRVVMKAVAEARQLLTGISMTQLGGNVLKSLLLVKIGTEDNSAPVQGVTLIDPYNRKTQLGQMLNMPAVVIGSTSGGLFNIMKYTSPDGKHVNWSAKPFDLVVVDEASQMSIPEGVLAGAFLKPSGSMIVVGDHRQMPPITAHPWKEEEKRDIVEVRPFLSLFESLVERGFPFKALDESFRVHEDIATFLNDNIYARDGIHFHSKRKDLILPVPKINGYVDAVLNPNYPIVVVEHTEHASQQYNPSELALTQPIVQACVQYLQLDGRNGIGVVVPHRAQKALLCQSFPELAEVRSIDTVERFQGDERDVIIVSATASDPDYVLNEADFLLNLNRLNVAISRPRKKLIVIASRSVIDLLTSDLDVFENAVLWKRLYYHYAPQQLYTGRMNQAEVIVKGRQCKQ